MEEACFMRCECSNSPTQYKRWRNCDLADSLKHRQHQQCKRNICTLKFTTAHTRAHVRPQAKPHSHTSCGGAEFAVRGLFGFSGMRMRWAHFICIPPAAFNTPGLPIGRIVDTTELGGRTHILCARPCNRERENDRTMLAMLPGGLLVLLRL